jgi:hypothetical protein
LFGAVASACEAEDHPVNTKELKHPDNRNREIGRRGPNHMANEDCRKQENYTNPADGVRTIPANMSLAAQVSESRGGDSR